MPDCLQFPDKIAPGLRLHPNHLTMPEHISQTPNPPNQSPQILGPKILSHQILPTEDVNQEHTRLLQNRISISIKIEFHL